MRANTTTGTAGWVAQCGRGRAGDLSAAHGVAGLHYSLLMAGNIFFNFFGPKHKLSHYWSSDSNTLINDPFQRISHLCIITRLTRLHSHPHTSPPQSSSYPHSQPFIFILQIRTIK